MTPFSSVAMLEKLALLSIALCKAPVISNASWRRTSVTPSALPISSATRGPFPVSDIADFPEKRAAIRTGTALVGPATKEFDLQIRYQPCLCGGSEDSHSSFGRRLCAGAQSRQPFSWQPNRNLTAGIWL